MVKLSTNRSSGRKQINLTLQKSPSKQVSSCGVSTPCGVWTPGSVSSRSTACTLSTASVTSGEFDTHDWSKSSQGSPFSSFQSINTANRKLTLLNITSESSGRTHRTNIPIEINRRESNEVKRGMSGTKVEDYDESKEFDELKAHQFD